VEQREQSAKNARLQNKGASTNIGLSKTRVPVNPIVNHPFPIVQWQFWGGITYISAWSLLKHLFPSDEIVESLTVKVWKLSETMKNHQTP